MKEVTLTLTEDEANIVAQGLAELPLKVSVGVFAKIKKQVTEQSTQEPPQS